MRGLNEVEAAQALGEVARERRSAGLPGLDPGQAAGFLRGLCGIRSLPECFQAGPAAPVAAPQRAERPQTTGAAPRPRREIRAARRGIRPSLDSDSRLNYQ